MANITKYVLCDNNCKFEALDKEETISAIQQAIEEGGVTNVNPEKPFITKIKDQNTGIALTVWVGTAAQFNALTEYETNCVYVYPDDFEEDTNNALAEINDELESLNKRVASAPKRVLLWSDANGVEIGADTSYTTILTTGELLGKRIVVEFGDEKVRHFAEVLFPLPIIGQYIDVRSCALYSYARDPIAPAHTIIIENVVLMYQYEVQKPSTSVLQARSIIATCTEGEVSNVDGKSCKVYSIYEIVY